MSLFCHDFPDPGSRLKTYADWRRKELLLSVKPAGIIKLFRSQTNHRVGIGSFEGLKAYGDESNQ